MMLHPYNKLRLLAVVISFYLVCIIVAQITAGVAIRCVAAVEDSTLATRLRSKKVDLEKTIKTRQDKSLALLRLF